MAETAWLKCVRENYGAANYSKFKISQKKLNELLEHYNAHLQRLVFGDYQTFSQSLQFSIIKSGGVRVQLDEQQ